MTNEELNAELYEKVLNEFEEYEKDLLESLPQEILKHAYAYTVRQDIILSLECNSFSDKQVKVLLKSEHPLEDIFTHWENNEEHHMEAIKDTIECTANEKIRDEFIKSQRESR